MMSKRTMGLSNINGDMLRETAPWVRNNKVNFTHCSEKAIQLLSDLVLSEELAYTILKKLHFG